MRASSRTLRAKWRLWHLLRAAISIEDVVERVAAWRGRPIQLLAFAFPQGELSGMWLALNGLDVVVFPQDASPLRRVAIIGHSPGDAGAALSQAVPELDVARYLGRTMYTEQAEAEAERLGTQIVKALAIVDAGRGS